jgi:nitrogen fixation protein FixH
MTNPTPKKSKWGIGIFALYGGFVLFILGLVAFASYQRFDLVDPDYYQRGLEYEQQIDKLNRTAGPDNQTTITYRRTDATILLTFSARFPAEAITGTATLYRPSNSSWDQVIPLHVDADHMQAIPAEKLAKGRWRIKIDWKAGDSSYFTEDIIDLE